MCWVTHSLSVHEVLDGFLRWIALVEELVVVVEEARVALKVVLLASEELVDLGLPGGVEGLALGLRTVVAVVLIREVSIGVVHVLAVVDVEVGWLNGWLAGLLLSSSISNRSDLAASLYFLR